MASNLLPRMDAFSSAMKCLIRLIAVFSFSIAFRVISQDSPSIVFGPNEGEITVAGSSQSWSLYALRDSVYSFVVKGENDFDPIIQVRGTNGTDIISNDDLAYPDIKDAILQAITIPQTGDYEIIVSGFADATGEFTLTALPGYASIELDEDFSSSGSWTASDPLSLTIKEEQLEMDIQGIQQTGIVFNQASLAIRDFYTQADFTSIESRESWITGLIIRYQQNGDHYAVSVNSSGSWRFTAIENSVERVVRDWSPHPAIVPGETNFTLGVLANGIGFDIFYDSQLVGKVSDPGISEAGTVGFKLITANALNSRIIASVDNLLVTVPTNFNEENIFPQQLVQGNVSLQVQELERRHVIPAGGQLVFTVEESFYESRNPGVEPIMLGRGASFNNFALSTTASLQVSGSGVSGCGLLFRRTDDTDYTVAYLDSSGGYGVSERSGDQFSAGIYGENPEWGIIQQSYELIIVVNEDMLYYFIEGVFVGSMEIESVTGEVGNVLVSFDPVLSQCRFTNTWLWNW